MSDGESTDDLAEGSSAWFRVAVLSLFAIRGFPAPSSDRLDRILRRAERIPAALPTEQRIAHLDRLVRMAGAEEIS